MRLISLLFVTNLIAGCALHPDAGAATCPVQVGQAQWQVELATTDAEREKGLMFRETMPEKQGMVFVFPETRKVAMWMKNTLIPLDMVFADETRRITHIQANTVPQSETIIPARGNVKYVLELNAGQAEKNGIRIGDILDLSGCIPDKSQSFNPWVG